MSKIPVILSLLVLATFPFALGCTSSSCQPIPDGVYVAIGLDGGTLFTAAYAVPLAASGVDGAPDAPSDAATDAFSGAHGDAATDATSGTDAATRSDAATRPDAATLPDAATHPDAAAHVDAAATHPDAAATDPDAAPPLDAGTDAATEVPVTYTFHGGLPAPYDTWTCNKPTASCEMTYICTQGGEKVAIVTSYSSSTTGLFAFSVTPPGTIVKLRRP